MIVIVFGVPGSGKTYFAINHLLRSGIIVFDEGIYRVADGYILITNVDGIRVSGVVSWDAVYQRSWYDFKTYTEVFNSGKRLIFVIDEAQKYFSKLSQNELLFFQLHRHYGVDILLITQNLQQLDGKLVGNAEYLIRALPKSDRIFSSFRYHVISSLDKSTVLKKFSVPVKEEVFFLYRSFEDFISDAFSSLEGSYSRNYVIKAFATAVFVLVLLFFVATFFLRLPSSRPPQSLPPSVNSTPSVPAQSLPPVVNSTPSVPADQVYRLEDYTFPSAK